MNITPQIVRSVQEEVDYSQLDEFQLDSILDIEVKNRSEGLLRIGEILLVLDETKGYEKLGPGYQSIYAYANDKFAKSKSWCDALMRTVSKFHRDLGVPIEDLAEVSYGKLNKVVSLVSDENLEEVLDKCRTSTQQELAEYVKEQNGDIDPTESDEEKFSLKIVGNTNSCGGIASALMLAREAYAKNYENLSASDITDFNALDLICAEYVTSRGLACDIDQDIDQTLRLFAQANNLKPLIWERNGLAE